MTDQKAMRAFLARRATTILALLERAHHAHRIGTDVPHDAGSMGSMQAVADTVGAGIEQSFPAATARVVSNSITAAAIIVGAVIDVAEP